MKKILSVALCLLVAVAIMPEAAMAADVPADSWAVCAAATYAGGTGTKEDPYQIATPEQLAKLAVDTNSGIENQIPSGKDYFVLTADIDLAGKLWQPIGVHQGNNSFAAFYGHLDGNGKSVTNMIVRTDTVTTSGLFGTILAENDEASVRNLTIKGADVVSTAQSGNGINNDSVASGVLVGNAGITFSASKVVIDNCKVLNSTVSGKAMTGGLLGNGSYAEVTNSSVKESTVNGGGITGGFIGGTFACVMTNDSVGGLTLAGTWTVGGFAGNIFGSSATGCEVKNANVTATDWNAGGFVGYIEMFDGKAVLKDCTAQTAIHSTLIKFEPRVGGFAGNISSCSDMSNCVSLGKVTSDRPDLVTVGAFAGKASAQMPLSGCLYENRLNAGLHTIGNDEAYTVAQVGPYYADYTAVDKAVAAANALDKNLYKDFSAVTAAIDAVDRNKKASEQSAVDAYATAINSAVSALQSKSDSTKKMLNGDKQGVIQGKPASFRSEASLQEFKKVMVDGKEVAPENYDLKEGSTIVVLHADFLRSLGTGTHTINIVSTTGTATGQFTVMPSGGSSSSSAGESSGTPAGESASTVAAGEKINTPNTGDSTAPLAWGSLLAVSVAGAWMLRRKYSAK